MHEKLKDVKIVAVNNNTKAFKPKKIPIFLGIFCTDKDVKEIVYVMAR